MDEWRRIEREYTGQKRERETEREGEEEERHPINTALPTILYHPSVQSSSILRITSITNEANVSGRYIVRLSLPCEIDEKTAS